MMKVLPLREEHRYLETAYMAGEVSGGQAMSISTSREGDGVNVSLSSSSDESSLFRIAVYQRRLLADAAVISNQTSLPVTMIVEDASSACENENCTVLVQIKNMETQSYVSGEKQMYSMQCLYHEVKEEDVFCEEANRTIHVRCDGLFQGRINVTCPVYRSAPSCFLHLHEANSFFTSPLATNGSSFELFPTSYDKNVTCSTVKYDSESTTCACSFGPLQNSFAERRRRLQMENIRGQYLDQAALTGNKTQFVMSVVVGRQDARSAATVQYLHYRYNTHVPTNSSQYPEFILTIRTWLNVRNVSDVFVNLSSSSLLISPSSSPFTSYNDVNLLSSSDQDILKDLLRQRIQENLKFFVTDIHYLNASYVTF